jgi:hypothetical protein
MTKLELTASWPTVVRMAGEGASLREIAEEVNATPGAINTALKRNNIEKAPAPPGPRARRGASPPPPSTPKAPKVAKEIKTRQKGPKAAKPKTFPEVLVEALGEFGFTGVPGHFMATPEAAGIGLRAIFMNLGLTPKDNLSNDNTDDCDENAESVQAPCVPVDADVNSEDDNGDCDGEANTDNVEDDDPAFAMTDDFMGPVPSGNGPEWGEEIVELADCSSVQTPDADPNEQTLRGEVIDDWGTPAAFTIPDDETLSTMNRDELRKLAANPGLSGWKYLKGASKMSADVLRANLAKVRNDSV